MLRLHPPPHSVPDNFWHTLLILSVSAFFVWLTGLQLAETLGAAHALTAREMQLAEGAGPAILQGLFSMLEESSHPFLLIRLLSLSGWLAALSLLVRSLKTRYGFIGGLPGALLLFVFPGLSLWLTLGGAGTWAVYFFLKAFFRLSENETKRPLLLGGGYVAVAVLLDPLWILPALGVLAGCWEVFRVRSKWVVLGFAVAGLVGIFIKIFMIPGMEDSLAANSGLVQIQVWSWSELFFRHLLLTLNPLLLMVYGRNRRGLGWWTLLFSLGLVLAAPLIRQELAAACLPLCVFSAIGMVKLPNLLDLRFPRAYQSVLLCQLLLWMPVWLGNRPLFLFSPPSPEVVAHEAP